MRGSVTVVNWCQVFLAQVNNSEARHRPRLVSTSLRWYDFNLDGNLKKYHTINIGYSEDENDATIHNLCEQRGNKTVVGVISAQFV